MRLRELRTFRGMTQAAVAGKVGISMAVYSYYERDEREPSIKTLKKLANFFGVTVDYLIENDVAHEEAEKLSKYEIALVAAGRLADDRARKDALALLQSHRAAEN